MQSILLSSSGTSGWGMISVGSKSHSREVNSVLFLCADGAAYTLLNNQFNAIGWRAEPAEMFVVSGQLQTGSSLYLQPTEGAQGWASLTITPFPRSAIDRECTRFMESRTLQIWVGTPVITDFYLPDCFEPGQFYFIGGEIDGGTFEWILPPCPDPSEATCWEVEDLSTSYGVSLPVTAGEPHPYNFFNKITLRVTNPCGIVEVTEPVNFCGNSNIDFQPGENISGKSQTTDNFISVYPNPVQNQIYFNFDQSKAKPNIGRVEIVNTQGIILVDSKQVNEDYVVFDLSENAPGIYTYRVSFTDGTISSGRFIIAR